MRDFSKDHSALALNTATLGHNLPGYGAGWSPQQIVDACAERGYGGITFWQREFAGLSLEQAAEIGDSARRAGLGICGLCRTPYLIGRERPAPASRFDAECEQTMALAGALQAESVTVVVGGIEANTLGIKASLDALGERLQQLATMATLYNTRVGLEPLHPVYAANRSALVTLRDAIDIIQRLNHAALGVAVDVYHLWWDSSLAHQLQRLQASQIVGFHLCDWLYNTTDVLLDRGMMGDGVADLKALRAAVEGAGYKGLCEVEIFSVNHWWKQPPELVLDEIVTRFRRFC